MADTIETLLAPLPGYRSDWVARFVWQLDAQRASLLASVDGLEPETLAWQPHPGMNTIGMLLAHIAFAETHLTQIGLEGRATSDPKPVIGISEAEEGLPLAADAPPAPALDGKKLAEFADMLSRARAYTKRVARGLDDADLERRIERPPRPDGGRRVFNVAWMLYHILEHEAGHRAQILLLLHLRRARAGA